LLDTPGHPRKNRGLRGHFGACACLEAAISLPFPRRIRAGRVLALAALLVVTAAPVRADFYRWTDADGVTHYSSKPELIPGRYRESAERVERQLPPAKGPLPVMQVEPLPDRDEAGFAEPGLGERRPAPARESGAPAAAAAPAAKPAPPSAAGSVAPLAAAPAPLAAAPEPPPADVDPRTAEIAELERELDARREELKTLISESSFDSSRISSDPRLRELAEVVPRLQAELDALRGELER